MEKVVIPRIKETIENLLLSPEAKNFSKRPLAPYQEPPTEMEVLSTIMGWLSGKKGPMKIIKDLSGNEFKSQ